MELESGLTTNARRRFWNYQPHPTASIIVVPLVGQRAALWMLGDLENLDMLSFGTK